MGEIPEDELTVAFVSSLSRRVGPTAKGSQRALGTWIARYWSTVDLFIACLDCGQRVSSDASPCRKRSHGSQGNPL
jgi:hypothetical protein